MATIHEDVSPVSAWFEEKVVENYRLFFSIAYQILGSTQEAEEVTQDAILKAWSRLGELHDAALLVGWVARIARNAALDRKKLRVPQYLEDNVLDGSAARHGGRETDLERADDRAALVQEIGRLPEGQAEVVTLRFFEGLDVRAIASRLGLMENAVRVRLHRGLENLRRRPRLQEMSGVDA